MEAKPDRVVHSRPYIHKSEGKAGLNPQRQKHGGSGKAGSEDLQHPSKGHFWDEPAPAFLSFFLFSELTPLKRS